MSANISTSSDVPDDIIDNDENYETADNVTTIPTQPAITTRKPAIIPPFTIPNIRDENGGLKSWVLPIGGIITITFMILIANLIFCIYDRSKENKYNAFV